MIDMDFELKVDEIPDVEDYEEYHLDNVDRSESTIGYSSDFTLLINDNLILYDVESATINKDISLGKITRSEFLKPLIDVSITNVENVYNFLFISNRFCSLSISTLNFFG